MSDEDNTQSAPIESTAPAEETKELSFAEQIREAETPEAPETAPASEEAETKQTPETEEDKGESVEEKAPTEEVEGKEVEKSAEEIQQMSKSERADYYYNLRQQAKQSAEQAVDRVYQPQQIDQLTQQYMDQGYDEFQATMLARDEQRNQREQISEARAQIAELNMGLATGAMEVVNSIDWLNSEKADTFDEKSADIASDLYEKLALNKDPHTGQIVGYKMTPQEFYQAINQVRANGQSTAQITAQRDVEKQMAAVTPTTSTAPQTTVSPEQAQADRLSQAWEKL